MGLIHLVLIAFSVAYGSSSSSMCVAVGISQDNSIAVSTDGGSSWKGLGKQMFDPNYGIGRSICHSARNDVFLVAGGGRTAPVVRSKDGLNWTPCKVAPITDGGNVAANEETGAILLTGYQGALGGFASRSMDGGQTFTLLSPKPLFYTTYGLAVGKGGIWIMAGSAAFELSNSSYGLLLSQDDGETWNPVGQDVMPVAFDVAYSAGRFVAVCPSGSSYTCPNNIAVSPDGRTWKGLGHPIKAQPISITRAGPLWFATALGSGVYATSADAVEWTNQQLPITNPPHPFLWGLYTAAYVAGTRTIIGFGDNGNSCDACTTIGLSNNGSSFDLIAPPDPFKNGYALSAVCI